jgi:battenin
VFISRSSISAGLPALPARWIKAPAFLQAAILAVLALEAGVGVFGSWGAGSGGGDGSDTVLQKAMWTEGVRNVWCVFALVCLEGVCGGLA